MKQTIRHMGDHLLAWIEEVQYKCFLHTLLVRIKRNAPYSAQVLSRKNRQWRWEFRHVSHHSGFYRPPSRSMRRWR